MSNDPNIPDSIKNPPVSSEAEKAVDEFLNPKSSRQPVMPPAVNVKAPEVRKTVNSIEGKELSNEQAAELINRMSNEQLAELAKRIEAVKAEEESKKSDPSKPRYFTASEFSNVSEKDIYDFSVPIQAIDHSLPDFLDIKLKDPNYVARWINLDPRRMGQAIAEGWSYIKPEDLAVPLKIQISNSADGHFVYADVVAMKLTKEKVYGRIRANFLKSLSITKSTLSLHEHMANLIKAELAGSPDGPNFEKYSKTGKMGVYSPLAGA